MIILQLSQPIPADVLRLRAHMVHVLLLFGLLLIAVTSTPAQAQQVQNRPAQADKSPLIPFSADVKRQLADRKTTLLGKIFVSPEGIRSESARDDMQIVRIHKLAQKTVWTLFLADKTYTELTNIPLSRPALPDEAESPCQTNKEFSCQMVGPAKLNERSVIHWEITTKGPQGRIPYAHLWIDPRLKIAIREQYADGLVEELGNIKEGSQPSELFDVPKEFKKIDMPVEPEKTTQ